MPLSIRRRNLNKEHQQYVIDYYARHGIQYNPYQNNSSISAENPAYRGIFTDSNPQPTDLEKEDERLWIRQLCLVAGLAIAPFILKAWLPDELKTLSWLAAAGTATWFAVRESSSQTEERRKQIYNIKLARQAVEKQRFQYGEVVANAAMSYGLNNRILAIAEQLPMEQRLRLLKEYDLIDIAPPHWFPQAAVQTVDTRAVSAQPMPVYNLRPDSYQDADPIEEVGQIYDNVIKKNVFWLGGQGDSKTVSSHFGLYRWLKKSIEQTDPEVKPLVVMVFDPHQGKNNDPNYASIWHGLPVATQLPTHIQSCVFKGDGAELLAFLRLFDQELRDRKNGVSNCDFDILAICEEFGSTARNTDDQTMKSIADILGKLGTETRKFGINYWLIAHSCTQKELKIDRTTLRNCVAAVGYGVLTDSSQIANLPQQLVDTGIAEVTARRAGGQHPAGLATSMFEAPYLPISPLNTLEMRDLLNPPQKPQQAPSSPEIDPERQQFAIALRSIRLWWDMESSPPDDDKIVRTWCNLTSDTEEDIRNNLDDLKRLMALPIDKFDIYVNKLINK